MLITRFGHTNRDGTLFTPAIAQAVTYAPNGVPHIHLSVVDVGTLHHVDKQRLMAQGVLDALAVTVGYPVKPVTRLPGEGGRVVEGLAYAVLLRPPLPPTHSRSSALPRSARLSLDDIYAPARQGRLLVPIGVSANETHWTALPQVGHALVVGATRSGKTTWLRSALAALLNANDPTRLRVALFDPKGCEFNAFETETEGSYLFSPVAYTPEDALAMLGHAAGEMDRRNQLFAEQGVRAIENYNQIAKHPLPYLLVVLDEVGDLLGELVERKVRTAIAETLKALTCKARNTGVALWAATHG